MIVRKAFTFFKKSRLSFNSQPIFFKNFSSQASLAEGPQIAKVEEVKVNEESPKKKKFFSLYKRHNMPKNTITFNSNKSQELLVESIQSGYAESFFQLMEQYHTQSDPTFCGPSTMVVMLNSLQIDPRQNWKGVWRWYYEELIHCLDLEQIKSGGMNIEEFNIVSRCNGVFTEFFRPDLNEEATEKLLAKKLSMNIFPTEVADLPDNISKDLNHISNPTYTVEINNHSNVVKHRHANYYCTKSNRISPKIANYDFVKTALHACTRRKHFHMITNTSRKALGQTGSGHFSPIAAYNDKYEGVLMLDVARFKYYSMWVKLKDLWNSFLPLDTITKKPRGFLLASRYHYLYSDLCRLSVDLISVKSIEKVILKISQRVANDPPSTESLLKLVLASFNDINFKSTILYYSHELENRCSNDISEKDHVPHNNKNVNISKESIYKNLSKLADSLRPVFELAYKEDKEVREVLKFLHYAEETYFLELYCLFFISLPKEILSKDLLVLRELYENNNIMRNEINCMKFICGTLYNNTHKSTKSVEEKTEKINNTYS